MNDSSRTSEAGTTLQERIESSTTGRAAISSLLIVAVAVLVIANLPGSELRRSTFPLVRPFMETVGLEQNWAVFAPDPRREVLAFEARITYTDGTKGTWRVPNGGPLLAPYRDYHWQKWVEWVTLDESRADLWEPAALWVARSVDGDERHPAEVTLVRRWYEVAPPGSRQLEPEWHEFAYFTLELSPDRTQR